MEFCQILTAESNGAKVGGWYKWDCSFTYTNRIQRTVFNNWKQI